MISVEEVSPRLFAAIAHSLSSMGYKEITLQEIENIGQAALSAMVADKLRGTPKKEKTYRAVGYKEILSRDGTERIVPHYGDNADDFQKVDIKAYRLEVHVRNLNDAVAVVELAKQLVRCIGL